MDGEVHSEFAGCGRELGCEEFHVPVSETVGTGIPAGSITGTGAAAGEGRAQEEVPADVVIELLVLHDVEAAVGQERGDRPNDAGPLGAGQGEDEFRRAGPGF